MGSPQERAARGKEARRRVPRERHAEFDAAPTRRDPVDLLEGQARTRIPELVPIRYGRMSASPFAFYRGAALVMATDLSTTAVSGLRAQICGDAHLANFGTYATPERRLVFDIDDFDETVVGPWEWDVKRLAASVEIAGRDRGFSEKLRQSAVLEGVRSYRTAMRDFASMPNLAVWYARVDVDEVVPQIRAEVGPTRAKLLDAAVAKSRTRDSAQAFSKLTERIDGRPRIVSDPPLVVPVRDLAHVEGAEGVLSRLVALVSSYRRTLASDRRHLLEQFRVVDAARKVVGVGSVGTRDWIVMLLGRDDSDPLILQAKEAGPSVLEPFVGRDRAANAGQRIAHGQRLMQAASDIFLGWDRMVDGSTARDFYLRQFRDWKGSVQIDGLTAKGLAIYARYAGWTLARAHARAGDRIAIAAYLGKSSAFDEAIAQFAGRYADQNERDHRALVSAIGSGRVAATSG
jgi:uncharacterized protein (DUF2252 family)